MTYKRILTIQDISCFGQCSLTVALPIISACGVETCVIPSAVLSTHTGGFTGFTFRDLTDDIPAIQKHWQSEGIKFDAIYTGYLGSTKQIAYVEDILGTMCFSSGKRIVDPAMADNGVLYVGFNDEYVDAMKGLCAKADIILPNITEACFLTGYDYKEDYDEKYIDGLISELTKLSDATIILTGVGYSQDTTGVLVFENGKQKYYKHKKLSKSSHGMGDVYASTFVGALMNGFGAYDSSCIAADYTVKCIENTIDDDTHSYGVKFEPILPELIEKLKK